jgi:hypothetical protein
MATEADRGAAAAPEDDAEREDRELIARANAGEAGALEALVRRHQAYVFNIAVRMLYCPQDAEDATQEILIKVVTKLSTFEGRSRFRTWLYRIATNHLELHRGVRQARRTVAHRAHPLVSDRRPARAREVVWLLASTLLFKRPVTSELLLIPLWAVLQASVLYALASCGWLGGRQTVVLAVLTSAAFLGGLVC